VSWFDKVVDAVQAAAVMGERIDRVGKAVGDLAIELRELDRRVSRLEGVVTAWATTPPPSASLPPPHREE